MSKSNQQRRKDKSLHHIIWQCNRDKFNISEQENKIIITQKQHDAFNLIFGNKQTPKEQIYELLNNRRWPVLSNRVRQDIVNILNLSDREFYLKKLVK